MGIRRCTQPLGGIAICAALLLALSCAQEEPSTQGPEPAGAAGKPAAMGPKKTVDLPDPNVVTVPDLAVAVRLNRFDQVASKLETLLAPVIPGFSADMVKQPLRQWLADPELAGLDQTRSIMFCVFAPAGSEEPAAAGLLPVTSNAYQTKFETMGQFVYQKEGGKTLVWAENEAGMVAARTALEQLEAVLNQPMPADFSVYCNVDLAMARYGDVLTEGLNQAIQQIAQIQQAMGQQQPNTAAGLAMMTLMGHGFIGAAQDMKDFDLNASLNPGGVEVSMTLRAKPGSDLAAALEQAYVPDRSVLGYVPMTGAINAYMGYDTAQVAAFLDKKLDAALAAAPAPPAGEQPVDVQAFKDFFVSQMKLSDVVALDLLEPGGGAQITGVAVYHSPDPDTLMASLSTMGEKMQELGLADPSQVTYEFQENVREHNGVAIHKFRQQMNTAAATGEMPPVMAGILSGFTDISAEVAVIGNYIVYAYATSKIEPVIDALKAQKPLSSKPLHAQSMIEEGNVYADVHIGRFCAYGLQFVQAFFPQLMQAAPRLKALEADPITACLAMYQGKLHGKLAVPRDPISQAAQIIMSSMATQPQEPVAP